MRNLKPLSLIPLALLAGVVSAQEPPFYQAARTLDPISVDGRLDEFTWAALPRVGQFQDIRPAEGKGPAPLTSAALAWDDQMLYVAFACVDQVPWSTMMERDMRLWEQEVVELFLDPDADGKDYPELEVSPNNVVVDLLIPAPGAVDASVSSRWDIEGLETAVSKHAAGWTVEIAVPWRSLEKAGVSSPPRPGDRWRVGLYRIERAGDAERAHDAALEEKLSAGDHFLAWAPTERTFHEPERFGVVEFVLKP